MADINLLPWRQILYAHTQRKKWFFRLFFVGVGLSIWMGLHSLWAMKNHQLDAEILSLKSQLNSLGSSIFTEDVEGMKQVNTKQKNFWRWFRLFDCLSHHHIQLNKIDYQVPQVSLAGRVRSMVDFSNALVICHFPPNPKITLHPLHQSDFLQFSIVE